ncbi:MAG: DUF3068 domain-containing protein [Jatrophihabitans sp.]
MRRKLGLVAVVVALFSLGLATLLAFYVPDRVKKTPLDLDVTLYGTGSGLYFNAATNTAAPVKVRTIRHVKSDTSASDGNTLVVNQGLCIVRDTGGTPTCSRGDQLINVTTERIAANRVTALAQKGYRSPADNSIVSQLDGADVEHVGLTLKFPFDAQKKTYPFWDYNLKTSQDARYTGEDKIDGQKVYVYQTSTPKTAYEVLPGVKGFYTDNRTLFVEPETGSIIKSEDQQLKQFANGSIAAKLSLETSPESVKSQLKTARDGIDKLHGVTTTYPIIFLIIGIVVGIGAVVLLIGARDPDERTPANRYESDPVRVG